MNGKSEEKQSENQPIERSSSDEPAVEEGELEEKENSESNQEKVKVKKDNLWNSFTKRVKSGIEKSQVKDDKGIKETPKSIPRYKRNANQPSIKTFVNSDDSGKRTIHESTSPGEGANKGLDLKNQKIDS